MLTEIAESEVHDYRSHAPQTHEGEQPSRFALILADSSSCAKRRFLDYWSRNRTYRRLTSDLPFRIETSMANSSPLGSSSILMLYRFPKFIEFTQSRAQIECWRASFLSIDPRRLDSIEPLVYELSNIFHNLMLSHEEGEPILVADRTRSNHPRRIFLVRYSVSEGGSGESKRPIFRNQLTGHDHEMRLTYPTQREHLDRLQSVMESHMYGMPEAQPLRVIAENMSTRVRTSVRAIVSESLVSKLAEFYEFAW